VQIKLLGFGNSKRENSYSNSMVIQMESVEFNSLQMGEYWLPVLVGVIRLSYFGISRQNRELE